MPTFLRATTMVASLVGTTLVLTGATAYAALPGPVPSRFTQVTAQAATPVGTQPAQGVPVAGRPTPPPNIDDRANANELRNELDEVLRQYPPTLRDVLRLDPSLLTDDAYLAAYPALASFLARYPQIARNPKFYVGDPANVEPRDPRTQAVDMWRHTIETMSMLVTIFLVAGALAWLVRTALDHRRWLRASRVQVEVHQKLFDRLAGADELMTYIQTPAGQRFLEASPSMSDPSPTPRAVSAPVNRILWSVQIGVVLVPLGLGLQWVARQVIDEVAQLLWFVGVLAVTTGIGFVVSAAVAYFISRRLGLIRDTPEADTHRAAPLV